MIQPKFNFITDAIYVDGDSKTKWRFFSQDGYIFWICSLRIAALESNKASIFIADSMENFIWEIPPGGKFDFHKAAGISRNALIEFTDVCYSGEKGDGFVLSYLLLNDEANREE